MDLYGMMADNEMKAEIGALRRRINCLKKSLKEDNKMSDMLREIVGQECEIGSYDGMTYDCTVMSLDDEWMKLQVHEKKCDKTQFLRVDNVAEITLK